MRYLLPVIVCVTAGCAARGWNTRAERRAYGDLIGKSPSYLRARQEGGRRVYWRVQSQSDGFTEIYVGCDMGTHSCRVETLRVDGTGTVERLTYDEAGDETWVADR